MSQSKEFSPEIPLVASAPTACWSCQRKLCLRVQVINLSLGQTDTMQCLSCLAKDNGQSESDIVESIVPYILSRDCFAKEWRRYAGRQNCPAPGACNLTVCDGETHD